VSCSLGVGTTRERRSHGQGDQTRHTHPSSQPEETPCKRPCCPWTCLSRASNFTVCKFANLQLVMICSFVWKTCLFLRVLRSAPHCLHLQQHTLQYQALPHLFSLMAEASDASDRQLVDGRHGFWIWQSRRARTLVLSSASLRGALFQVQCYSILCHGLFFPHTGESNHQRGYRHGLPIWVERALGSWRRRAGSSQTGFRGHKCAVPEFLRRGFLYTTNHNVWLLLTSHRILPE